MDTIKPTVKIRKDSDCYVVIFVDGTPRIEAMAAFNTNEIPTAFTENANACDVTREIKRLNPDCNVIFV